MPHCAVGVLLSLQAHCWHTVPSSPTLTPLYPTYSDPPNLSPVPHSPRHPPQGSEDAPSFTGGDGHTATPSGSTGSGSIMIDVANGSADIGQQRGVSRGSSAVNAPSASEGEGESDGGGSSDCGSSGRARLEEVRELLVVRDALERLEAELQKLEVRGGRERKWEQEREQEGAGGSGTERGRERLREGGIGGEKGSKGLEREQVKMKESKGRGKNNRVVSGLVVCAFIGECVEWKSGDDHRTLHVNGERREERWGVRERWRDRIREGVNECGNGGMRGSGEGYGGGRGGRR